MRLVVRIRLIRSEICYLCECSGLLAKELQRSKAQLVESELQPITILNERLWCGWDVRLLERWTREQPRETNLSASFARTGLHRGKKNRDTRCEIRQRISEVGGVCLERATSVVVHKHKKDFVVW
jgi:hypothetical protein